MSEYERGKFFRRTKFYPTSREPSHPHFSRPYNKSSGFVKHEREYRDSERSSFSESKEKAMPQPTILLKAQRDTRTERSVSPKRPAKENEPPQSAPTSIDTTPVVIPTMTHSIKFLEDGTLLFETLQEYLQDSPDFLVVGVLGNQGSGKTTIMNLLAQNKMTEQFKNNLFNCNEINESIKILTESVSNLKTDENETEKKNLIFNPQSLEQIEVGNFGTNGIDIYITSNRVFLLDCQPFMSAAALDEIVQSDFKRTVAGEFLPIENCAEIQSLQLATFLLSVCHVVLLVEDWFMDTNVPRFLQTAEMLKPSIPTPEEDYMEYFPHVLIVHNRATLQDFTPTQYGVMQQIYREVFSKSKLRFESGMGLGVPGSPVHGLSEVSNGEPFNLFLLPELEETQEESTTDKSSIYRGHPGFDELIRELRTQVHSVTRVPLFTVQLTEKNWLQFSTKVWDAIKKSSFFLEYSKLMP